MSLGEHNHHFARATERIQRKSRNVNWRPNVRYHDEVATRTEKLLASLQRGREAAARAQQEIAQNPGLVKLRAFFATLSAYLPWR